MRPTLLDAEAIQAYLDAGHWSRETMAERYAGHARERGDAVACRDETETYTWAELEVATDRLAGNLIGLGLARDSRVLVQMPSSCKEMALRMAFKKAGVIGVFAPMQWRRRELDYVLERIQPDLLVTAAQSLEAEELAWAEAADVTHRIDLSENPRDGWIGWRGLADGSAEEGTLAQIPARRFAFDVVSLITASSGTSGLAKLCEWPEAAQVCVGRLIAERLGVVADDTVGIFAPMAGAAGVLVWNVSATVPATYAFPAAYRADHLLGRVPAWGITVATTVPVILARLAQESLANYDLAGLRVLRVGTAAADVDAARVFEEGSQCRVVVAAGSMECPGFAHAHVDEPKETRLSGAIGRPLPGARLRIEDQAGREVPAGGVGELKITAPYAASGYWNDPDATAAAWQGGWYASGDMGLIGADGRLRLLGRLKETINRSGLKILPAEVEREIARHPDVFECAVVAAPDAEYGEVPWAFVQMRPGRTFDPDALIEIMKDSGLAAYKTPARFIAVDALPRVAGSKVDKKRLMELAPP